MNTCLDRSTMNLLPEAHDDDAKPATSPQPSGLT